MYFLHQSTSQSDQSIKSENELTIMTQFIYLLPVRYFGVRSTILCLMIICASLLPLALLFDFIFIFEGDHFRGCEESQGLFVSNSNSRAIKMCLPSYE